jgi:hypothetical protein
MMLVLLVFALIGDLLFLPAILVSPLGRFIGGTKPSGKQRPNHTVDAIDVAQSETPAPVSPIHTEGNAGALHSKDALRKDSPERVGVRGPHGRHPAERTSG